MAFKEYSQNKSLPEMESSILDFWRDEDIFNKSIEQNRDGKPFVFFEGPPTANARPGIHHVLSRVYKDIYIRYHSLKGHYVPRRAGWDCHGLPVEREVEKNLGINTKAEIEEKVGLLEFNRLCRESILTYVEEWNRFTHRMGFWIDLENAYFTMHNSFIESVWSLLKIIWEKELIYQDYRVVPYDPIMGATLSDAEVALGYKTVEDPSLTVRFRLADDKFGENCSFLVWTTTPWTLPSNVALAVAAKETYQLLELEGEEGEASERVILASALVGTVIGERTFKVIKEFPGSELEGVRYQRLFDWLPVDDGVQAFYLVSGDFVTMDTGTGIVHIAPAYGADDLEVGKKYKLPVLHGVGLDGNFIKGTPPEGTFFKEADRNIVRELKERGQVWRSERFKHEYPHGYRTGAPLLYYAKFAWYIRTTDLRDELIKNNNDINWTPEHIKTGRFGRWLENNRDWALSRERYWGTPLPLWGDGEGNFRAIGSVAELEELTGKKLTDLDLHRPHIDEIEFKDPESGATMRRVPEVIDCWFDSGAMPYAQWGYPINGDSEFKKSFPADFITEAVDQTRGWFYTLLAVGTMVSGCTPYRNVICLGHVVDDKGEKMSKSKGNTVDPDSVFDSYGADALRWYFLTGAPPGNSRRVGKPGTQNDPVKVVLPLLRTIMSSVSFFTLYAGVDRIEMAADWEKNPLDGVAEFRARPEIDRWILSTLQQLTKNVSDALDNFDSYGAGKELEAFAEILSNWYIRRNRRRFWKGELDSDKLSAYATLHTCLVTLARLMAPLTPFLSEDIFRTLVSTAAPGKPPASVHLSGWPTADFENLYNEEILREGDVVLQAVRLGRVARKNSGIKVRQPLRKIMIHLDRPEQQAAIEKNREVIIEELNIKTIEFLDDSAGLLDYRALPNLPRLGKRLGGKIRFLQQYFKNTPGAEIARSIKESGELQLELEGEKVTLEAEDVLLESVSRAGTSGAEGGGVLVALDTNLDDELLAEGYVRDLVRNIQELRKQSGLEVTDRIKLHLAGSERIMEAATKFQDYIESETLAQLTSEELASGDVAGQSSAQIDSEEIKISLQKSE